MNKSQELYVKAKMLIPGGTQLLSKRPEMFLPDNWPAYYNKAEGCSVWDLDGKKYIDTITMGIGSCILGFADIDVNNTVKNVIDAGSMSSLNPPEEVALAEMLCDIHRWAEMARFTRTGGEAMTVAVRIARAAARKDRVLFCGYHGWHDWYISANLSDDQALDGHLLAGLDPSGVPRALKGSSIPFEYNDTEAFLKLIDQYDDIGVVVLEAIRNESPEKTFVEAIRQATQQKGIVFVVDEITSGWRLNIGGAHLIYDMVPDIAVFAKGMSNGYPMGAIIGKREVMEASQASFISSTYWTDRIGPAAAIKTIEKMKEVEAPAHLITIGKKVQEGWEKAADRAGLSIDISGIYPLSHFSFNSEKPLVYKTMYTQLMLKKGFLASTVLYSSLAHNDKIISEYLEATEETFSNIQGMNKEGNVEDFLEGPICHSGFQRLN